MVEEDREINITRRLTKAGEQRCGLTAMLRAVIDHVDEAMPEHARASLSIVNGIGDGLLQILIVQGREVRPHGLFILAPTLLERLQCGELGGKDFHSQMALPFKADPPCKLAFEDVGHRSAQAAVGKFRIREELFWRDFLRGGEDLSVCPVIVVVEEVDGGEVHGSYFTRCCVLHERQGDKSPASVHVSRLP